MSLRDLMLETFKQNYHTNDAGAYRLLTSYMKGMPIILTVPQKGGR